MESGNEFDEEIPYFSLFLNKYSKSNVPKVRHKLLYFSRYCKEKCHKHVLEMEWKEILSFFQEDIDKRDVKKVTKKIWRNYINSYYEFMKEIKSRFENEAFNNPVPSRAIWDFSGKEMAFEDLELDDQTLTLEAITQILHHVYHVIEPPRIFMVISLLAYTGARITEIMSIELKNLDLDNRWFITNVKSFKKEKRVGIYFFPEFFVGELRHYINLLKLEHASPKYLFQERNSYLTPITIRSHLSRIKKAKGLKCRCNPHAFRDFLNTKRFEMGCRKPILEFLLNQKVRDVNPSYYLKKYKTRVKLRELYDKFNPFPELIKPL